MEFSHPHKLQLQGMGCGGQPHLDICVCEASPWYECPQKNHHPEKTKRSKKKTFEINIGFKVIHVITLK